MSQAEVIEKMENGTPGHTAPAEATAQSHTGKSDDPIQTRGGSHAKNGTDELPKPTPPVVQISRASEADGSGLDEESADESSGEPSSDEGAQGSAIDEKSDQGEHDHDDRSGESQPVKEWKPPDEALQQKVIKQVEFYFSDANIVKDAFLLKHVRRNKQGYVSIKLIASFKKVRSLTKDWKAVRYSLQQSEKLEVNNEGTKVKRKAPLPEYDETANSRTVVAVNLPMENPNVEKISNLFQRCGDICLVRIIRPGHPVPQDVRKQMESHVEYNEKKACALIEFDKNEFAQRAVKMMNDDEDWRSGLHVSLLVSRSKKEKKEKKSHRNESLSPQHGCADGGAAAVDSGGDGDGKKKKRRRKKKKTSNRLDELSCDGSGITGTPSSSDVDNPSEHKHSSKPIPIHYNRSPNHLSPSNTPKSSPCPSPHGSPRSQRRQYGKSPLAGSPGMRNSPRNSPRGSPEIVRKNYDRGDHSDSSNSQSPWARRRMLLAQDKSPLAAGGSPSGSPMLGRRSLDPSKVGLLRSPVGPVEGVTGFYGGKGRGKPASEP